MSNSTEIKPTPEQQAIIDSKESTIVVSNPGTGKTTTLALKVIDLLENGVNPEEILCITFTIKAKKEMFDKIYSMAQGKFSDSDILKIRIHTFHGFTHDYLTEAGFVSSDIIGNNFLRYSMKNIGFCSLLYFCSIRYFINFKYVCKCGIKGRCFKLHH